MTFKTVILRMRMNTSLFDIFLLCIIDSVAPGPFLSRDTRIGWILFVEFVLQTIPRERALESGHSARSRKRTDDGVLSLAIWRSGSYLRVSVSHAC